MDTRSTLISRACPTKHGSAGPPCEPNTPAPATSAAPGPQPPGRSGHPLNSTRQTSSATSRRPPGDRRGRAHDPSLSLGSQLAAGVSNRLSSAGARVVRRGRGGRRADARIVRPTQGRWCPRQVPRRHSPRRHRHRNNQDRRPNRPAHQTPEPTTLAHVTTVVSGESVMHKGRTISAQAARHTDCSFTGPSCRRTAHDLNGAVDGPLGCWSRLMSAYTSGMPRRRKLA